MDELRDANGDLTVAGVNQIRNDIANRTSPVLNAGTDAVSAAANLFLPERFQLQPGWYTSAATSNSGVDDKPTSGTGVAKRSTGASKALDYYMAPLATRYGMSAATAYQEALANTAHQREIEDLKAAGLNPILSTRYGGSAGVSGAEVMNQGGSGGYGGSGAKTEKANLGKIISTALTIGGVVAAVATGSPVWATAGATSGKAVSAILG